MSVSFTPVCASSLSDLKNRSENLAGRGQILPFLRANSGSIGQKNGGPGDYQLAHQGVDHGQIRAHSDALIFIRGAA